MKTAGVELIHNGKHWVLNIQVTETAKLSTIVIRDSKAKDLRDVGVPVYATCKNLTQGPGDRDILWVITKDHDVCNDCENATEEQLNMLKREGYTVPFKLFDDDGNLYYSGLAKPDTEFEPLDDFGMPNAGCTEIQYLNPKTGNYETL